MENNAVGMAKLLALEMAATQQKRLPVVDERKYDLCTRRKHIR